MDRRVLYLEGRETRRDDATEELRTSMATIESSWSLDGPCG